MKHSRRTTTAAVLSALLRRKLFLAVVLGGATFASVYAFAASRVRMLRA